jgi:uncharacterized protein with ParB-like and HNH nuclease domain
MGTAQVFSHEEVPERLEKLGRDEWIVVRRFKPYFVVDGQQRLTTVVVL